MIYGKEKVNSLSRKEIEELNTKARDGKLSPAGLSILKEKKVDNGKIQEILNHR